MFVKLRQRIWPQCLSAEQRFTQARERLPKIVDNLAGLFHLHEANRIISYSDALSKQVPRSYAGNAFLVFQQTMLAGSSSGCAPCGIPQKKQE